MNHCVLMAEIVQAPELRYTSDNQTPVVEFMIQIPGLRPEDASTQLKAIGWGNLAQDIQSQYHLGDRVVVEGRLSMKTLDRPEGFKEKQVEVTAQRIYRLTDLQSMSLAAANPASVTAAATVSVSPDVVAAAPKTTAPKAAAKTSPPTPVEPDYDDIPF